jgi:Flp pilus assembly pilin Flp
MAKTLNGRIWTSVTAFLHSERGAVTIDWVVLTAALTGLSIAVASMLLGGATESSGAVGNQLTAFSISTEF